jgi:3(or 17)beta-hydroxysteroid dehydrogenase
MPRLDGKVAIVTGGTGGIGSAITRRFIDEGARVVVGDIRGAEELDGLDATFVEHDVTDENSWRALVGKVLDDHGTLDILANNAGIGDSKDASDPENATIDDWRRFHSVNVEGVFLGCKTAIPVMARTGGGAIVNTASLAAHVPMPHMVAYATGKAGVLQMTRSLALYCARNGYGIRCNSVSPGAVLTPTAERIFALRAQEEGRELQDVLDEVIGVIPMGVWQDAVDIANAVVFLASDEARYVTGEDIRVDGGIDLAM